MGIDSKKNFIRETIEDNFEDFTVHNIKKLGEGWMIRKSQKGKTK